MFVRSHRHLGAYNWHAPLAPNCVQDTAGKIMCANAQNTLTTDEVKSINGGRSTPKKTIPKQNAAQQQSQSNSQQDPKDSWGDQFSAWLKDAAFANSDLKNWHVVGSGALLGMMLVVRRIS